MMPRQFSHWLDVLTARGHRHQILGLPASDADEEQLEDALRAAVADEPTTRILHLAALDSDTAPSTQSLLRMQHQVLSGTRRLFRAAAAAELRTPIWLITRGAQRVTECGHGVTGAVRPVGVRSRRLAGTSTTVGRTGRFVRRRCRRVVAG